MADRAPLGIGIVGCGVIARNHLRALLRFPTEARVVALASRSPESVDGAASYLREQAVAAAADPTCGRRCGHGRAAPRSRRPAADRGTKITVR